MDILRISVLGIAGVLLAVLLQKEKVNTACLSVWQSASAFLFILLERWRRHQFCKKSRRLLQLDQTYITLILKMVGITYVAGVCDEYL